MYVCHLNSGNTWHNTFIESDLLSLQHGATKKSFHADGINMMSTWNWLAAALHNLWKMTHPEAVKVNVSTDGWDKQSWYLVQLIDFLSGVYQIALASAFSFQLFPSPGSVAFLLLASGQDILFWPSQLIFIFRQVLQPQRTSHLPVQLFEEIKPLDHERILMGKSDFRLELLNIGRTTEVQTIMLYLLSHAPFPLTTFWCHCFWHYERSYRLTITKYSDHIHAHWISTKSGNQITFQYALLWLEMQLY